MDMDMAWTHGYPIMCFLMNGLFAMDTSIRVAQDWEVRLHQSKIYESDIVWLRWVR